MKGHPTDPGKGTDFDWAAKLEEVLGSSKPVDMSSSKIYAKAEFSQGTVGTCEFVKVRENCLVKGGSPSKFVVPLVEFDDSQSSFNPRAVALSLVVELSGKAAQSFMIELENLDGSGAREPITPARRTCTGPSDQEYDCIEFSITNLPNPALDRVTCHDNDDKDIDSNIKNLTGSHWQAYYGLLSNGSKGPNPRPVRAARPSELPTEDQVVSRCLVFPPRKERKPKDWFAVLSNEVISSTQDRPICPIGTP